MQLIYKNIFILICGLGLVACEPEIDDIPTASSGEADFSTYVALGNSLTAGYSDGALYLEAQQNSYPSIIAEQLSEVGGGVFTQPLVPTGNGFGGLNANQEPNGKLVLSLASGSPSPVRTPGDLSVLAPVSGPFNNFGVPGAKAGHLVTPGYGSEMGNPFFARFATSPAATLVTDAAAVNPTFFTLWIGNNDVLGFATSGGEGDEITEQGAFDGAIDNIIAGLKSTNANIEGAIANIPNVTKIPYFTTVPWNAFVLESQEQVDQLNAGFSTQIETGVSESVTAGVIMSVVTEKVILGAVTQAVVTEYVFITELQRLIAEDGLSETEAMAEAAAYIGSAEGMTEIGNLISRYEDETLQEPLQTAFAENINENYQPTFEAYEAGLLPEQQMDLIDSTIEENFNNTLAAYNAGILPEEDQMALTAAIDSVINVQVTQLKAAGFYPEFQVGPNGFVVAVDEDYSPTGLKQITENELMLLTFASVSEEEFNPAAGMVIVPDQYALDASELSAIETARTGYNAKLESKAETEGFAFVDMAGFFDDVADNPLLLDGVTYSTTFVTGNVFSLDGVHLTQAGAAIVANEFIKSINEHYNASVPVVANVSAYDKVTLP